MKGFSKTYKEQKLQELEKKLKEKNGGKLPDSYDRADHADRFEFNYGVHVAKKLAKAKKERG